MKNKDKSKTQLLQEITTSQSRIKELEILEKECRRTLEAFSNKKTFDFAFFEYIPVQIIIVDKQGSIVYYNLTKQLSKDRLPKAGDIMYKDYGSQHKIDMYNELIECIHSCQIKTFIEQKYKDRYLNITISPFPNGAIIISQDVTERKKTEIALRDREKQYRSLFDGVVVGMYRISAGGKLLDVNPALVQMLGYQEKNRLLQKHIEEILTDPKQSKQLKTLLNTYGKIHDLEFQINHTDRIPIWVRVNAYTVYNHGKEILYYEGSVEDITEARGAQDALEKSEKEKDLILSSLSEVVVFINPDYEIIWANKAAGESVQLSQETLIGKHCHKIWYQKNKPCLDCPVTRVFKTNQPQNSENQTPDGRYWSKRSYPVRDEQNRIIGVVQVMLDISRRRRIEKERDKIQTQLLQSQKMEAVGTLAGGIAHDFNNLLTAIQGCVEMAMLKMDTKDKVFQELEEVRYAANRASDLTRQLLIFSRKHPTQLVPTNLNNTIVDLLKMIDRLIGEDIGINTKLESDLWAVKADSGTIEQVIFNLVVNARDAMPSGGELFIKTENLSLDKSYCMMVPEARPGHFIRLTIADTGIGMNKKTIQRIFDPFYSTKLPGKGTGLGLSVVYGIVKNHEGWINVYSEPDKGSEFKIYLPVISETPVQTVEKTIEFEQIQGNKERILIVEDEKVVREFAKRALRNYGYTVFVASCCDDGKKIFEQHNGDFDLIFSDVVLPDNSGLDLIDYLLQKNSNLNILLSSGYTDTKSQWSKIMQKGYRFLQKPYTLIDLLRAIKTGLNEK